MIVKLKIFSCCVIASAVFLASVDLQAATGVQSNKSSTGPKLYRYRNAKGSLVTSYVVPPDMVTKGYEVITPAGDVLEVVRPVLTVEEKQEMLNAIEQEKFDKSLLLKYGSLAELMRAQKRKNDELQAKMSILKGNLANVIGQIESQQKKAADFERQGKRVPENILTSLDSLYAAQDGNKEDIHLLEKDAQAEKIRFEYEVSRYKQLKGLR